MSVIWGGEKPGMFQSWKQAAVAFSWVWAPVIAVIIWKVTR